METSVALAARLCGASEEDALLKMLCAAAEQAWEQRLGSGVDREACEGAFLCAAAFTAAADYLCKGGEGTQSFTVGDVTVRGLSGHELAEQADVLRETAERLMRAYAVSGDFCFRGVRG